MKTVPKGIMGHVLFILLKELKGWSLVRVRFIQRSDNWDLSSKLGCPSWNDGSRVLNVLCFVVSFGLCRRFPTHAPPPPASTIASSLVASFPAPLFYVVVSTLTSWAFHLSFLLPSSMEGVPSATSASCLPDHNQWVVFWSPWLDCGRGTQELAADRTCSQGSCSLSKLPWSEELRAKTAHAEE